MSEELIQIPDQWKNLDVKNWSGSILLFGQVDVGKSTFARFLYQQLLKNHESAAFLDADLGQQAIGPPATIGLAISGNPEDEAFPPAGDRLYRFVGSTTPRGHFLPLLMGMHHLQQSAVDRGASAVVINTSGFINPMQGAAVLKWAKVEMLKPSLVIAFQQERELEPILAPLRRLLGSDLCLLVPSEAAEKKSEEDRRRYRSERYRAYFKDAQAVGLSYKHLAVFPNRTFYPGQLVGLDDAAGMTTALGIIEKIDSDQQAIWIKTPWWGQRKVTTLRLGTIKLDQESYMDEPIQT